MRINSKNRGFVEGTLVLMADGKQKPIEQIQTGDYVLSFNESDADAPLEAMPVTNTFSRIDNNILEVKVGEETLLVAENQMFIGPHNDWKEVYSHSLVVDVEGNPVDYTVSKINKGKHKIYDITVEENHSLVANGIRVHNFSEQSKASQRESAAKANAGKIGAAQASRGFGSGTGAVGGKQTDTKPSSKPSNTKVTNNTQKGPGGQTSKQSANNSMGSRNNSGGDRRGGGDSGSRNPFGNNQTVSNGAGGRKKKSRRAYQVEEPTPNKPSGVAVGTKLIETIENSIDVLQELVIAFDPLALTAAKISIQTGIDSIYRFANEYVAAVYAAEMQVSDKTELISVASSIMNLAAELRNPFEETVVSAAGKKIALIYLVSMEGEVARIRNRLGVYTTDDTKGNLTVEVDGVPNSKRTSIKRARRDISGRWTFN